MDKNVKSINIKLPLSLWKKVKILSVHHDSTIELVIREMIEKSVTTKKVENIIGEEPS